MNRRKTVNKVEIKTTSYLTLWFKAFADMIKTISYNNVPAYWMRI